MSITTKNVPKLIKGIIVAAGDCHSRFTADSSKVDSPVQTSYAISATVSTSFTAAIFIAPLSAQYFEYTQFNTDLMFNRRSKAPARALAHQKYINSISKNS